MKHSSPIRRGVIALALLAGAVPAAASAQAVMAPRPTPNADRLAAEMRKLADNPRDLSALIAAGELSADLGDPAAAMQFFARAEKIDPRNPRVIAGRASALLEVERPGEALKLFNEAERMGLPVTHFAADRGLAYDLLGYPERAQADYRLALKQSADDEVTRRLAMSLGISGEADEAVRLLTPLLNRNDRSAWRVRAMVVAMNGDFEMADKIAASMLPGFGPHLAPFFRRLPDLSPGDRAFAGHFGQLEKTPQRMADASMAPPITPLGTAAQPVALADAGNARRPQVAPSSAQRIQATSNGRRIPQPTPAPQSQQPATALASLSAGTTPPASAPQAAPAPRVSPVILAASADEGPIGARLSTSDEGVLTLSARPASPATVTAPASASPAPGFGLSRAAATEARTIDDDVIGRIVGGINIPGAELNVPPMPRAAAPVRETAAPEGKVEPKIEPAPEKKAEPEAKPEAAEAKPKPKPKPKPAPKAEAEPARHWVQVAGGARAADLDKDWARLAEAAPAAFKGKQGWTAPVNATNRLLAGPFKTAGEAQEFVNALAEQDISSFPWTSEAGQKIERLKR